MFCFTHVYNYCTTDTSKRRKVPISEGTFHILNLFHCINYSKLRC